jgi:hypothetical protein
VLRLLVAANVVPSLSILVTLIMEATRFSETSLLTRATRRNIPEHGILYEMTTVQSTAQTSADGGEGSSVEGSQSPCG